MTSLVIAICAVVASGIAVTGILGLGRYFAGGKSPVDQLACGFICLFSASALLSLHAWWNLPVIAWLIWAALGAGAWVEIKSASAGTRHTSDKQISDTAHGAPRDGWKVVSVIVIGALLMDSLWAALPLYRYDQWTYHLVVSKMVDLLGSLRPPITYDPIFFTGTYEYLGLLARALTANDFFQQGFQNSLSQLLVVAFGARLFLAGKNTSRKSLTLAVAFASILLFATGDHEALANAKPDYILMMMALTLLCSLCVRDDDFELRPELAGALMTCGLAYKITWLHFAATAGVVYLWCLGRGAGRGGIIRFFSGAFSAIPLVLPYLVKNWQIFGNPLHPAQTSLWQSHVWGPEFARYWAEVSQKPSGLGGLISGIPTILSGIPARAGLLMLTLFLVWITGVIWRGAKHESGARLYRGRLACAVMIYICAWGAFYGPNIYNRFVSPLFAMGMVPLLAMARRRPPSTLLLAALLIPFVADGQIEVTARRLMASATRTPEELQDSLPQSPAANNVVLRLIARHREVNHPASKYDEATLMSDYPFNFYGPSTFYIAPDPVTFWSLRDAGIDPETGCAGKYFALHDIRYVWSLRHENIALWPRAITRLLPKLEPVPSPRGQLWHVPSFEAIAECPE